MNGFDVVARCLKAEGVKWMACFPANPLIEAVAKVEAAKESAFLNHFPSALPEPVAGNFLRKARASQAKANEAAMAESNTREHHERPGRYRSARGNAVVRS